MYTNEEKLHNTILHYYTYTIKATDLDFQFKKEIVVYLQVNDLSVKYQQRCDRLKISAQILV